jgi:hypothetical protein
MIGPRRPLLPVTATFFPIGSAIPELFTTSLGPARRVPSTRCDGSPRPPAT